MMARFETHCCDAIPDGFELRKYEPDGLPFHYPEIGGWVLEAYDRDSEWMADPFLSITPMRNEHIHFCPWCGKSLD